MKTLVRFLIVSAGLFGSATATPAEIPISESTTECLECHSSIHPGIVNAWRKSRHSHITPKKAMAAEKQSLKISSTNVPENLQNVAVGCAECHLLKPKAHADTFEHNGYDVHIVVSPNDCSTCHTIEAGQYANNIMAHAYKNLAENDVYRQLERGIIGKTVKIRGQHAFEEADGSTKAEACYYCHGTKLKVIGNQIRDTDLAGELEFPLIEGWPNQGVGRVNLDGSLGSCAACHTRHTFSIAMARRPYTCEECHTGPDVPAFKVYAASKHGNIFSAMKQNWDFNAVPWTIGKDFTAPTCATCHVSLLVNEDKEVVAERTHQMSDRLPWRIFGLIYAHPHPKEPDTTSIRNKDGLPLPTDFAGGIASAHLIDKKERQNRQKRMQAACLCCHGTSWVRGQWKRFENTIAATNAETLAATKIIADIWKLGYAQGPEKKASPFDEAVEKKWTDIWLFYGNAIRFASAMGCGGDYGVFADGRYQLSKTLLDLNEWLALRKTLSALPEK